MDEPHVTDQQNAFHPQPMPNPVSPPETKAVLTKPDEPKVEAKPKVETKEDHLGMIAELASNLHNVSPSGAETVRDKILERVEAIRNPKAYDERIAAARKVEEDAEALRAKDLAAKKIPVPEKAKV